MTQACQVLVVEDDNEVREALVALLRDFGWQSEGAVHGADALEKLRSWDTLPDVILLDLMMPVMDGRGFREEQLKSPDLARIPVVVISAFGHAANWVKEMGAAGFVRKPLDIDALVALIEKYVPGNRD